ncbi:MAG: outer membrane protein assembly factor BamB family protein [Gaiellales bacterium]
MLAAALVVGALSGCMGSSSQDEGSVFSQPGVSEPPDTGPEASSDWPAYLGGPLHHSASTSTAITPDNAASLEQVWKWDDKGALVASPTVFQGRVYIGDDAGFFTAIDLNTGLPLWRKQVGGVQPKRSCPSPRGIASTATVMPDPSDDKLTVYVAAADGFLYALDAESGDVVWKSEVAKPSATVNDYYNWSSPTVSHGKIYVGLASQCDNPLVRGGIKAYDQDTGKLLATYWAVPPGVTGGTIWSSEAVMANGDVIATTGNAASKAPESEWGDSFAIERLDGTTLKVLQKWTVPRAMLVFDSDFGASAGIWTAVVKGVRTPMVGACNKNGRFYALASRAITNGPVWTSQVDTPPPPGGYRSCLAAPAWDGSRLFVAGNDTIIGGKVYQGSIRQLDPATGRPVWQLGLDGSVFGSPSINGSGVLAVPAWQANPAANQGVYLVEAENGKLLRLLSQKESQVFSQPVFAGRFLLVASLNKGLVAYAPGGAG